MKQTFIRVLTLLLCVCMLLPHFLATDVQAAIYYRQPPAKVENDPDDPNAAQNITGVKVIKDRGGFNNINYLCNGMFTSCSITYTAPTP